ncbi:MAG: hypothetical protein CMM56_10445 [Rhodospirillaceae bacterium]|nr:hypothetical protein [Rhodospirillaceae bacterium]|tara:strand:- start:2341 stop:4335 length:1995 start_codon:yes stop_codon:yes gene_type:complete
MSSPKVITPLALWQQKMTRRKVLCRGSEFALISAMSPGYLFAQQNNINVSLGFQAIPLSSADEVIVPNEYKAEILLKWGDSLFHGISELDATAISQGQLMLPQAAFEQAHQFGYNCDGIGLFEYDENEVIVCVNHEYPNPELLFPGYRAAQRAGIAGNFIRENPGCVDYMKATVGLSIAHFETGKNWSLKMNSPFNRRITANTPMLLSGPARGHEFFKNSSDIAGTQAIGTLWNCAAGTTPWGTFLTAEEGVDEYFGNRGAANFSEAVERVHNRFRPRRRESRFRWEFADERFNVALNPNEPFKFGWIVEVDPLDATKPIKKRTALGRFKHEGATTVLTRSGQLAVYMGDDEAFEYFYKFVTNGIFDLEHPERNVDLLDSGTLYVARFSDDGTGEWIPLVWQHDSILSPKNGFASQADVVLRCREAADLCEATPMDRPEDVAVHPSSKKVYLACTRNSDREGGEVESAGRIIETDATPSSPRVPNPWGHIIELSEREDDGASTSFEWEIFILAGDPKEGGLLSSLVSQVEEFNSDSTYFAGYRIPDDISAFGSPDNLTFDADGNLWITTDGDQPRGNNDGCFVCPTEGPERGAVRQFMSGPIGCEITGCEITPDGSSILLGVQHPGEGGTLEEPISNWPEGGNAAPRPSVVLVSPEDKLRKLSG